MTTKQCEKCGVMEGEMRRHVNTGKPHPVHIVHHHAVGYKDDAPITLLCKSCHKKIHNAARNDGRCVVPVEKLHQMSNRASSKDRKHRIFTETMMPCVYLREAIRIDRTDHVSVIVYFNTSCGKRILYIGEKDGGG